MEMCIVNATYSTRCHMVHTRVADAIYALSYMVLIYSGNRETKCLYLSGRTYWYF